MFGCSDMFGNYESRKVERYDDENLLVSTAMVTDTTANFETAISHPSYNGGELVIVEEYYERSEAVKGHKKWVKIMTEGELPEKLIDVSTAHVKRLLDSVSGFKITEYEKDVDALSATKDEMKGAIEDLENGAV